MNAAGLSSSPNPRASFASSAGFPARAAAPAASSARVRGGPASSSATAASIASACACVTPKWRCQAGTS